MMAHKHLPEQLGKSFIFLQVLYQSKILSYV